MNLLYTPIDGINLERYEEIYRNAYWRAWDEKAQNTLERGSLMHDHAHEAGLRSVIDSLLDDAAKVCEEWGDAKVAKWSAIGDASMIEDAKSRAWDGLQCAAMIRALKP